MANPLQDTDPLENIVWEFGKFEGELLEPGQLGEHFLEDDRYGPVEIRQGIFGDGFAHVSLDRKSMMYRVHGYWCPTEKKVVIGKPLAERYDDRDIGGSSGIRFYCAHCPEPRLGPYRAL